MKHLFLTLITLFILSNHALYAQTGWLRQTSPAGDNLTSVSFINANTGYIGGFKKTLKTTNGGLNWIVTDTSGFQGACAKIKFLNALTGYAISQNYLFKTINGGISWASCPPTTSCSNLNFVDSLHGFLSFVNNYYITSNGGASWDTRYVYGMGDPLGFDFGEMNYAGFNFGVYTSLWVNPLRARYEVYIYKTIDQMGWFCVHGFVLPDSCIYWWAPFGNMQLPFYGVFLIDGTAGILYGGYNHSTIYVTTNTGSNWTALNAGSNIWSLCFTSDSTGFAASSGQILYTSDCGFSWIPQYAGVNTQINFIDMINAQTGWAVGDSGVILKTTTGGIITVPPPPVMLEPPDSATGISLTPLLQWMQIFGNPISFSYKVIIAADTMFNLLRDSATVNINSYQIPSGKLQNSTMYYWKVRAISSVYGAGPWSRFFRFTTGVNSISLISGEVPRSYWLYQNFPNPFNPLTKIKFDLPASRLREAGVNVQLVIYDALGRAVATLINEQLHPGTYEVEWDGTNYSSGIYFYKLEAEEFAQTKKMLLIK